MADVLKITLKKSLSGASQSQKKTAQALGLKKIGTVVEHKDNAAIRGMVNKLSHLATCEEA